MEARGPRQSKAPDARRTRTRRRGNTAKRAARPRPGPRVAAAGPTVASARARAPRGGSRETEGRGAGRTPHARPRAPPRGRRSRRRRRPGPRSQRRPRPALDTTPRRGGRRGPFGAGPRKLPARAPLHAHLPGAWAALWPRRAGVRSREPAAAVETAPLRSAHPGPRAEEAAARPLRRAGSDARTRRSCALAAGVTSAGGRRRDGRDG